MKITRAWVRKYEPCPEFIKWLRRQDTIEASTLIHRLKEEEEWEWIWWGLSRLITKESDQVYLVLYCIKLFLNEHKKKFPKDRRLKRIADALKAWVDDPSEKNIKIANEVGSVVGEDTTAFNPGYEFILAVSYMAMEIGVQNIMGEVWDVLDTLNEVGVRFYRDKVYDYGLKILKESERVIIDEGPGIGWPSWLPNPHSNIEKKDGKKREILSES